MKFDLKRPCKKCPFRNDIPAFLTPGRAREIADAILRQQQTFACHETIVPVEDDTGEGDMAVTPKSQHCAGAMIFLELQDRPNQMMRIAERLGMYDARRLEMDSPVFDNAEDMIAAQKRKA